MRVNIFCPEYNPNHTKILRAFGEGISRHQGVEVRYKILGNYEGCDIAVIFGAWKKSYNKTYPKKKILELHSGRNLLMVESGFVRRGEYWQIGWGGYAGEADFQTAGCSGDRWKSMGIDILPWFHRPENPFIVCGQVPWDTQVQDIDHGKWCRDTIQYLEKQKVEVKFRPHPAVVARGRLDLYGIHKNKYTNNTLEEDLKLAQCFVTWNSTSAIDALIHGVPIVVENSSSLSWKMGRNTIQEALENGLAYPDRNRFFASIGYSQWNLQEMKEGLPWKHLQNI